MPPNMDPARVADAENDPDDLPPLDDGGSADDGDMVEVPFKEEDEAAMGSDNKEKKKDSGGSGGEGGDGEDGGGRKGAPSDFSLKHGTHEKSLEDQANPISLWLLHYLNPILKMGAERVIQPEDLGVPSASDRAATAFAKSHALWKEEVARTNAINDEMRRKYDAAMAKRSGGDAEKRAELEKKRPFKAREPGVFRILTIGFGRWKVALAMVFYIASALLGFVPVLLLEDLVKFFESGADVNTYNGLAHPWVEVVGLAAVPLLISILQTRSQAIFQHFAVYVRTSVSTLLYEKSLCVSAAGRAATSTGQVVNMMSNDTTQVQRFLQFVGVTMVAPVQIVIALYLIYGQVGNATWVGIAFMLALMPVNVVVFAVVGKQRRAVLKYSDLRVKMMNEMLAGIRIIKYYAWERPFGKEVGKLRDSELRALTKLAYTSAVGFSLILLSAPIIQPILVFLTYINIQGEALSAATAFTTVALFNIMRFPFAFLPMGMLQFIQSRISLRRLGKYLRLPELEPYVVNGPHPDDKDNTDAPGARVGSVTMKNCSFAWVDPANAVEPIEARKPQKRRNSSMTAGGQNGDDASQGSNRRGSMNRRGSFLRRKSSTGGSMNASTHSTSSFGMDLEARPADPITLKDITCTIEPGSLVAVVGTVGSGKSSFLGAIMGEMEPVGGSKVYMPRGDAEMDGKRTNFASYCAQTPWVVNDTLRGNILFGRPFVQDRYDEVVKACALLDDLAVLPAGDATEIGERGINLSGGQKARVSLARALYSLDARVILMDDPLSAVDAHVGEHLFREAVAGPVTHGATRILVTHHVHFLPRCDKVIVLEGGRIAHQGTYVELIEQGVDFAGAVDVTEEDKEEKVADGKAKKDDAGKDEAKDSKASKDQGAKDGSASSPPKKDEKHTEDMKKKGATLTTKEGREEGSVAGRQYFHYARVGGMFSFVLVFFVQALGRGTEIYANFWLANWAAESVGAAMGGTPLSAERTRWYLNIYAAIGMLGVACTTLRAILMAVHRLNASKSMHESLVVSVLRAPVAFFDVTPTGRILNRFAADMDKVDLDLNQSLGQGTNTVFSVLGAVGAIAAATKGTFLIPLIPMSYLYYIVQKWFRRTSTEMQRVTSVAASPIFADFSQVLTGTSTVRAYGEQERFFRQCQGSFDKFNAAYNLTQQVGFWLGLRLDFLGGFIGAFIGGVAVATASSAFIPAGWLGLALSYAIEVTQFLKHGVRMIAQLEADMSSVERIMDYSDNIDSEAPERVPEKDPKGEWPIQGAIDVKSASMRYRDGPLVLKDISLRIKGGEKIGVVGRTGSGKSSLMNLLFRITELEDDGGKILIDEVDTSQIGTEALRLNLSIIPQDPVMFSNTVRYNLDPFGTTTDEQLWEVLKKVQLAEVIAALPQGLDDQVAEGGENFSQGQRQLLCIARSLLRNPRILVMDEATASIDNATDASIQRMIRDNFGNATVLTIAHRLGTIMDSDRVLVLDDGRVAEFNSPAALLEMEDGIFRGMVDKSRAAHSQSIED